MREGERPLSQGPWDAAPRLAEPGVNPPARRVSTPIYPLTRSLRIPRPPPPDLQSVGTTGGWCWQIARKSPPSGRVRSPPAPRAGQRGVSRAGAPGTPSAPMQLRRDSRKPLAQKLAIAAHVTSHRHRHVSPSRARGSGGRRGCHVAAEHSRRGVRTKVNNPAGASAPWRSRPRLRIRST